MNANDFAAEIENNPNAGVEQKRELLPPGRYTFLLEDAQEQPYVFGAYKKEAMAEALEKDPSIVPGKELACAFVVIGGDHANHKCFEHFIIEAASNHPDYNNFPAEARVKNDRASIAALFKRAAIKPEKIRQSGFASLAGAMFELDVTVKPDKKGVPRQQVWYKIKEGETIGTPTAKTNRPVAGDESPF